MPLLSENLKNKSHENEQTMLKMYISSHLYLRFMCFTYCIKYTCIWITQLTFLTKCDAYLSYILNVIFLHSKQMAQFIVNHLQLFDFI